MNTNFQYDVFISYSSKDKYVVRKLADQLKCDGIKVWFDDWEISPGDLISLKIEEGLEQSKTLLLAMSENSIGSDYVTLEHHTLLFKDPTNKQKRIIPIRLDDVNLTKSLQLFSAIDWRNESDDAYQKLLECLRK